MSQPEIRPLLEGYLHRRFPGAIPRGLMFGKIIDQVADSGTTGPLTYLRPLLPEFREVNDYARQFHHDADESSDAVQVVDGELLMYARRALALIYQHG